MAISCFYLCMVGHKIDAPILFFGAAVRVYCKCCEAKGRIVSRDELSLEFARLEMVVFQTATCRLAYIRHSANNASKFGSRSLAFKNTTPICCCSR